MDLKKPSRVVEGEVNFSQACQLKRLKCLNGCPRKKCIPYGHKSTAEERLCDFMVNENRHQNKRCLKPWDLLRIWLNYTENVTEESFISS